MSLLLKESDLLPLPLQSPEWEGSTLESLLSKRSNAEREAEADVAARIEKAFQEWKELAAWPLPESQENLLKCLLRGHLS